MNAEIMENIVSEVVESHKEKLQQIVEEIVRDCYLGFEQNGGVQWDKFTHSESVSRILLQRVIRDRLSGEIGCVVLLVS